jgi:hypothetical protein
MEVIEPLIPEMLRMSGWIVARRTQPDRPAFRAPDDELMGAERAWAKVMLNHESMLPPAPCSRNPPFRLDGAAIVGAGLGATVRHI